MPEEKNTRLGKLCPETVSIGSSETSFNFSLILILHSPRLLMIRTAANSTLPATQNYIRMFVREDFKYEYLFIFSEEHQKHSRGEHISVLGCATTKNTNAAIPGKQRMDEKDDRLKTEKRIGEKQVVVLAIERKEQTLLKKERLVIVDDERKEFSEAAQPEDGATVHVCVCIPVIEPHLEGLSRYCVFLQT